MDVDNKQDRNLQIPFKIIQEGICLKTRTTAQTLNKERNTVSGQGEPQDCKNNKSATNWQKSETDNTKGQWYQVNENEENAKCTDGTTVTI